MTIRQVLKFGAVAAVAALALAGCSSGDSGGGTTTSPGAKTGPFTIGVSNAFVGSEYRTQMIDAIQTAFNDLKSQGLVDTLEIENADADNDGQIQQIRNLINKGVDAIIVDPNSATALNAVFQEAVDQGIKVYAIDQAVDSPNVTNITISQQDLGAASATWFAQKVGDGAKIVTVEGTTGNPATDARWAGAQPIFAQHNIQVVAHGDGGWDQTTGQTTATNLLATNPDITGIWTYDGMAQGVLRAVQAANKLDTISVCGEARIAYMRMWVDLLPTGFSTVGIINPPGTGATALRVAVSELQGKQLDPSKLSNGKDIVLPLEPPVTNDTIQGLWDQYKSQADTYVLDSILTMDQVQQYFKS